MRKKEGRHSVWDFVNDMAINVVPLIIGIFLFFVLFGLFRKSVVNVTVYLVLVTVGMIAFYLYQCQSRLRSRQRFILISVLVLFATIFLFAEVYALPGNSDAFMLENGVPVTLTFGSALYFSTVTFTTLGYGDIAPVGYFRYVSMVEAITGLVLIGLFIYGMTHARR